MGLSGPLANLGLSPGVPGARVVRTLEQLAAWLLFTLAVITVYGILVVM